ncbi:CotJB protein [Desulfofarcimen acetoxidans DSM 771]|jgi:spore coat protein JB|uniref:CotJB protein n=2 Tax=Desulfofarcimen acetoxidans TaxID=58138 RepID=C8W3H7_DESAS|nr:CotJB protein [Desulfofarcimen acetoxidans DSM 771]
MDKERLAKLKCIMELEFTAIDLNLFLDTHPNDRRALAHFEKTVMELGKEKREYEERYGPLTFYSGASNKNYWQWIEEPWPWEIVY